MPQQQNNGWGNVPQLPKDEWPPFESFKPLAKMDIEVGELEYYRNMGFHEVDNTEAPGRRKRVIRAKSGIYFALIGGDAHGSRYDLSKVVVLVSGATPSSVVLTEFLSLYQPAWESTDEIISQVFLEMYY